MALSLLLSEPAQLCHSIKVDKIIWVRANVHIIQEMNAQNTNINKPSAKKAVTLMSETVLKWEILGFPVDFFFFYVRRSTEVALKC